MTRGGHGHPLHRGDCRVFLLSCTLAADGDGMIRLGEVRIDLKAGLVSKANRPVHWTPIEFRPLGILAAHAGCVATTPQLLREVWRARRMPSAGITCASTWGTCGRSWRTTRRSRSTC